MNLNEIPPEKRGDYFLQLSQRTDDVNMLHDGFTLLTWCCWDRLVKVARDLMEDSGADPNAPNWEGTTALTWAPDVEFTSLLVKQGARVEHEKSDSGEISLHHAAEKGRLDQTEFLISKAGGNNFLEAFDDLGETPLAKAARCGHIGVARYLLELGSNPNAYDVSGLWNTVLQNAVYGGNQQITRLLLDYGGRVETRGLMPSLFDMAWEQRFEPDILERLKECACDPPLETRD